MLVVKVAGADGLQSDPLLEVITKFEGTHRRTSDLTVHAPDGCIGSLQARADTNHERHA